MTAERLSLATAYRMNRNIVGTFFNMLEKVATKNNLSDNLGIYVRFMKVAYK